VADDEVRRQAIEARQYLGYLRGAVVLAALVGIGVGVLRHSPVAGFAAGIICALVFAFVVIGILIVLGVRAK
jgi:hypothetical protein